MDPALYSTLPLRLSEPRLAPYFRACEGHEVKALRLYTWNVEVSAAFWGVVHSFEIAMRNALHEQMAQHFDRADWWESSEVVLHGGMLDQLVKAKKQVAEATRKNRRDGVADDVVASLTFGFWLALLSNGRLQFETKYWQPFLHRAFPNYVGNRRQLHSDIDSVRLFRNRIAHHEPIFARHLEKDHESILRLTALIDADYSNYVRDHSRVMATLDRRDAAVERGLDTSF